MPNNQTPDTAITMMLALEQRVKRLENVGQTGNSSISAGAYQVLDPLGRLVISIGYQPDGSVGIGVYDPVTEERIISLGQTPGELSLYALSVLNAAGVLQQVAGSLGDVAIATQTVTIAGAAPVIFADGPSVTAVVGPSGEAEVGIGAFIASASSDTGTIALMVDGAVWLIPATTTEMLSSAGSNNTSSFSTALITGLSRGPHVFSHGYQLFGTGPALFSQRNIVVQPH